MTNSNGSPGSAVIPVESDVVASKCGELRERLRVLASNGVKDVTLSFRGVRLIDSAGIGMLIAAHNTLRKTGGTLAVVECSADILELLRSMRIHQHMRLEGAGSK